MPPSPHPTRSPRLLRPSLLVAVAAVLLLGGGKVPAALYNLTNVTINGQGPDTFTANNGDTVNGAVISDGILVLNNLGSGSGQYRQLFKINAKDTIDGYNRRVTDKATTFESDVPIGFDPDITIADLAAVLGYYVFAFDINEPSSSINRFLSLDELRIYVSTNGPNDPSPLPINPSELSNLGDVVWDMQQEVVSGSRNDVVMDYTLATGSGTDDLLFYLPTSVFDGYSSDSYVYLYAQHGALESTVPGSGADAGGFEEWAAYTLLDQQNNPNDPPPAPPIPEPSSLLFFSGGLMFFLRRRR